MTNEIALSENNTPTGKNNRPLIFHILVTHKGLTLVLCGLVMRFSLKTGTRKIIRQDDLFALLRLERRLRDEFGL